MKGSGTVVTGTLPAGTARRGQELLVTPSMQAVRVRGIESLKEPADQISGVARVALNLRGADRGAAVARHGAGDGEAVDADLRGGCPAARHGRPGRAPLGGGRRGRRVSLRCTSAPLAARHGSACSAARSRGSLFATRCRCTSGTACCCAIRGTRPASLGQPPSPARAQPPQGAWPALVGATVLDVAPPRLTRRGAAAAAAAELADWPDMPTAADLLRRHGLLRAGPLHAMGITDHPAPVTGDWLADPGYWAALRRRLTETVASHAQHRPLAPGLPLEAARAALGVPDRRIVEALVRPPLTVRDGSILPAAAAAAGHGLPERVLAAIRELRHDLATEPFLAPDAARLHDLGLDSRAVAAAERAGLLLRISEQIVLAPGADAEAARLLAGLPVPFTAAQARQVLRTTRRVAIPLLQYLDRAGVTERLTDDRRRLSDR